MLTSSCRWPSLTSSNRYPLRRSLKTLTKTTESIDVRLLIRQQLAATIFQKYWVDVEQLQIKSFLEINKINIVVLHYTTNIGNRVRSYPPPQFFVLRTYGSENLIPLHENGGGGDGVMRKLFLAGKPPKSITASMSALCLLFLQNTRRIISGGRSLGDECGRSTFGNASKNLFEYIVI